MLSLSNLTSFQNTVSHHIIFKFCLTHSILQTNINYKYSEKSTILVKVVKAGLQYVVSDHRLKIISLIK